MVRFSASQAVTISVPPQPLPIDEYLSEPKRLVYALVEESQTEFLGSNLFRVRVRPIRFLNLNIQPVCDIEVWLEADTVRLRSDTCRLEGRKDFNQKFSLNMQGYLVSQQTKKGEKLRGQANLIVGVDLPQAMMLTPKPFLEKAGNGLLNGILVTLKQRLMRQLIADYSAWATASSVELSGTPSTPF